MLLVDLLAALVGMGLLDTICYPYVKAFLTVPEPLCRYIQSFFVNSICSLVKIVI